jgi:hypothetical protein
MIFLARGAIILISVAFGALQYLYIFDSSLIIDFGGTMEVSEVINVLTHNLSLSSDPIYSAHFNEVTEGLLELKDVDKVNVVGNFINNFTENPLAQELRKTLFSSQIEWNSTKMDISVKELLNSLLTKERSIVSKTL